MQESQYISDAIRALIFLGHLLLKEGDMLDRSSPHLERAENQLGWIGRRNHKFVWEDIRAQEISQADQVLKDFPVVPHVFEWAKLIFGTF